MFLDSPGINRRPRPRDHRPPDTEVRRPRDVECAVVHGLVRIDTLRNLEAVNCSRGQGLLISGDKYP